MLHFATFATIDKVNVPEYTTELNAEYQQSAYSFFDRIYKKDLGLREILTSTTGFVSPAMAKFYGVQAPASGFAEVDLGPERPGYFAQLPYLALHALNAEPDSILRGRDINLEMLCATLGMPAAIPPLPPLKPGQTNRERITELTGGCGGECHGSYLNPAGFIFENFDGLGRLRSMDNGKPVDTSGSYPFVEGTKSFTGAAEFMEAMADGVQAHACWAKKLSSYALQRDIVASDVPLLENAQECQHGRIGQTGDARAREEPGLQDPRAMKSPMEIAVSRCRTLGRSRERTNEGGSTDVVERALALPIRVLSASSRPRSRRSGTVPKPWIGRSAPCGTRIRRARSRGPSARCASGMAFAASAADAGGAALIWEFDDFSLDDQAFELRQNGHDLGAPPKVLALLLMLARNAPAIVSHDELDRALWPGVRVTRSSLRQTLKFARRLLGRAELVRTVRGRGVRLDTTVTRKDGDGSGAGAPPANSRHPREFVHRIDAGRPHVVWDRCCVDEAADEAVHAASPRFWTCSEPAICSSPQRASCRATGSAREQSLVRAISIG